MLLLALIIAGTLITNACMWDWDDKEFSAEFCEDTSVTNEEKMKRFSNLRNYIFVVAFTSSLLFNITHVVSWIIVSIVGFPCWVFMFFRSGADNDTKVKEDA